MINPVEGDVTHDDGDKGDPVKIGGVYKASVSDVDDGDRADVRVSPKGEILVAVQQWPAGTMTVDVEQMDNADVVELINEPSAGDRRLKADIEAATPIRGGASLQDIIDAVDQSALAQRSVNEEGTLLTDATTAQTTAVQTSGEYKGVMLFVNIDSISGTSPSLTAKIQRETPGGVYQDVLSTGALSNSGLTTLQVHPSLTDAANEKAGELLGRDWRVDVILDTADGDESYQYDIEYTYVQ